MTLIEYINSELDAGRQASFSSIAREVPCAPSYISKIASGSRRPSFEMAKRIEMITGGKVPKTIWYSDND